MNKLAQFTATYMYTIKRFIIQTTSLSKINNRKKAIKAQFNHKIIKSYIMVDATILMDSFNVVSSINVCIEEPHETSMKNEQISLECRFFLTSFVTLLFTLPLATGRSFIIGGFLTQFLGLCFLASFLFQIFRSSCWTRQTVQFC